MQNHEAHSFTFEAYFPPPPHTLTHTSARVEDAFHKEVASTDMTTMATPLGGGFPMTRAIDIALCTIDYKGTWADVVGEGLGEPPTRLPLPLTMGCRATGAPRKG